MTQPDFIIIPTQILQDDTLQPSDRILFGYIYWMTKLALMKCVASNGILSELTGLSERTVRVGLERLEKSGYVDRIYSDVLSHHRLEIVCRLSFSAVPPPENGTLGTNVPGARHKRAGGLGTNVPHNKKINNKIIKEDNTTNVVLAKAEEKPPTVKKIKTPNPDIDGLFLYWKEKTGVPVSGRVKQNRFACSNLLKKYQLEEVKRLIDGVEQAQNDRFAPRICDFTQLQSKLSDLLVWGKTRMAADNNSVKGVVL